MPPTSGYDVVLLGHFARDRLIVDGRGTWASGGGVYYGGVALARLGLKVAVITRLHPDAFSYLDELEREGVDVFATPADETSGIANYYDSSDMERRVCKPLGFAGPFSPDQLPDIATRIFAVVPIIAGEVDLALLKLLAQRGPLALDVQGFVRVRDGKDLVFRPWLDMEASLACVDYLKVDRAEAEALVGTTDLHLAASRLAELGPKEVVVTQSSGVTVLVEGQIFEAPFTPRSLEGRTGRGDTCFCSYLGCRLSMSPQEAVCWAAAITTLKQEKPGPWRGTVSDVEAFRCQPDRQ